MSRNSLMLRLTKIDYVLGAILLVVCFGGFAHGDIAIVGWDSLNYLFGDFLEFYENCKKIHGGGITMVGTPYPPPVYAAFALWMYPFKLFGVITSPDFYPFVMVFWLKALTTITYIASGFVFYKICGEYFAEKAFSRYATIAFLTMPLAIFSQFIFSQYDIFYVLPMLIGMLMFLRGKNNWAAALFGIAITFKYFPAFVFVPLLLLYEKRFSRLALCIVIFALPTFAIDLLYGSSPAFIEGVKHHSAIDRVFAVSVDLGGWRVYVLFAAFTILCGLSYFIEAQGAARKHASAYIWLVSSILPFLFLVWHPQWTLFFVPAVILTTMTSKKIDKFMLLDLAGMAAFVAFVAIAFPKGGDAGLFRGKLYGLDLEYSFSSGDLFMAFGANSGNVFLSAFWGYMLLQIILKFRPSFEPEIIETAKPINYWNIRRNLFIGTLLYLVPTFYAVSMDLKRPETFINLEGAGRTFGELTAGRIFEQTFEAKSEKLTSISLFLATYARPNTGSIYVELVEPGGKIIFNGAKSAAELKDNAWVDFPVGGLNLVKNAQYRVRLTSTDGKSGNAITWWAAPTSEYLDGEAFVDGVAQNSDFTIKLAFAR